MFVFVCRRKHRPMIELVRLISPSPRQYNTAVMVTWLPDNRPRILPPHPKPHLLLQALYKESRV